MKFKKHLGMASVGLALLSSSGLAGVTIGKRIPAAGDVAVRTQSTSMEMSMEVVMGGNPLQKMDTSTESKSQSRIEVLETAETGASKVSLEFMEHLTKIDHPMMGENETEADFVGDVFHVGTAEEELTVTYDDGGKPDDETLTAVRSELPSRSEKGLFDPSMRLSRVLSGQELEEGQAIEVPAEIARQWFPGGEDENAGISIPKMSLTLTGVEEVDGAEVAMFDLALQMKINPRDPANQGMEMEMVGDMTGEVAILVDSGWVRSMTTEGPFAVAGSASQGGMNLEITGESKMNVSIGYEYSRS